MLLNILFSYGLGWYVMCIVIIDYIWIDVSIEKWRKKIFYVVIIVNSIEIEM